jgi:hypothetical protein
MQSSDITAEKPSPPSSYDMILSHEMFFAYEKIGTRNAKWVGDLPRLPVECFECLSLLPSEDPILLIDALGRATSCRPYPPATHVHTSFTDHRPSRLNSRCQLSDRTQSLSWPLYFSSRSEDSSTYCTLQPLSGQRIAAQPSRTRVDASRLRRRMLSRDTIGILRACLFS